MTLNHADESDRPIDALKSSFSSQQINGAVSKLISASIGDLVTLFSRSPAHKHFALADIEWMIVPPVWKNQFYVVDAQDQKSGFRAPTAAVTWAFVSPEIDAALESQVIEIHRLRPDDWASGSAAWLIDAVGTPNTVRSAMQWLRSGPFKTRHLKIAVPDGGRRRIVSLETLLAKPSAAHVGSA